MTGLRTTAVLLAAALALAACRSPHGAGSGPPELEDLAFPAGAADVAVTIYPTPRRVAYGERLLPLDGAPVLDESSPDAAGRIEEAGLDAGFRDLPAEGYVLLAAERGGETVVVLAARDGPGRRRAEAALGQITVTHGGRRFVREARVLDAPVFPLRGSKRPQEWEMRYGANFAWEVREGPEFAGREVVATFAPGSPLDATRVGAERILDAWRAWQRRGVRRFCLKFDDVGFGMTPDTELHFGTYAGAVRSLLSALRDALRAEDPSAVLYFLPQTYWWNDARMGSYARAIQAAGGIDADVGLVMTGPDVISATIDAAGLAAARGRFGSSATAALVYDNLGREGDWGPLAGRDPDLASLADGVFGERGTPVNRLTRLDWLWNPQDYDPERSWRRAILELAGPREFDLLLAACDAFRRGAPRAEIEAAVARYAAGPPGDVDPLGLLEPAAAPPVPRATIAALLAADIRRLGPAAAAR